MTALLFQMVRRAAGMDVRLCVDLHEKKPFAVKWRLLRQIDDASTHHEMICLRCFCRVRAPQTLKTPSSDTYLTRDDLLTDAEA